MSQLERAKPTQRRAPSGAAEPPYALEYAIIAVLIAAVAVGTWKTFGEAPPPDAADTAAVR